METTIDRLVQYMAFKGLNNNKVTVEANLSIGLIGKAIKNGKGMNTDSIEKILHAYSDLSSEWLITGEGEIQNLLTVLLKNLMMK